MAKCWEIRGCPQDMLDTCPISLSKGLCLLNCQYARCFSPRSKVVDNPVMIFGDHVGPEMKAVKQVCLTCEYYLNHALGKADCASDE